MNEGIKTFLSEIEVCSYELQIKLELGGRKLSGKEKQKSKSHQRNLS